MMAILGFLQSQPLHESLPNNYSLVRKNLYSNTPYDSYIHNDVEVYFWGYLYDDASPAKYIHRLFLDQKLDGLKTLDGEFLYIIVTPDTTYVIRDRHGSGMPFYYHSKALFFTSRLADLHHFHDFSPAPNMPAIYHFLKYGFVKSPLTAVQDIFKLPAGYVLIYKKQALKLYNLYPAEDFANTIHSYTEEEATSVFETLLKESIKQRIRNTSEVNLLLSGGYDSGGNIASLRDIYSGKISTFSIGFKDNPWSELPLAKLMSKVYDTTHYEYEIDGHEIDDLPTIVDTLGDLFNESGMMVNYAAMRLMQQHKKDGVTLGGDGNDQHFGTAGHELAMAYKYSKNGFRFIQKTGALFSELPFFDKDNIFFKLRFFNDKTLHILEPDNFGFRDNHLSKLFLNQVAFTPTPSPHNFSDHAFDNLFLKHNYYIDIQQVINEQILFKASKLSQHFNIQLTFPYMSTPLYNYLKNVPRNLKLKGSISALAKGNGISKFLHKNYLQPKLPSEITQRKKQGGFAPLLIFFKNEASTQRYCHYIASSSMAKQLFHQSYLTSLLNHIQQDLNSNGYWFWYKQIRAFQLFNLLILAIWWDLLMEKKTAHTLNDLL